MRTDLREKANAALAQAKDDKETAIDFLLDCAASDKSLMNQLARLGAQQVIRTFYSDQRESAMSMAVGRTASNLGNAEAAQRTAARMARMEFWETYTLYGNAPLKTATKRDLIKSVENRETQIRTEQRYANFERHVSEHLSDMEDVVCEHLKEKDVIHLARKAMGNDYAQ
jgi:hypothetical protein